ncbi:hypothetical protein LTSEMIS_1965 [Salmonella enterica subsp. enterica serovar Mississippi str. A4-633]|nr:hypothetical protein LTSEMIS_1965 [Salmonella enterica subsp. enterica serovar Mississippi str. A4-633]
MLESFNQLLGWISLRFEYISNVMSINQSGEYIAKTPACS